MAISRVRYSNLGYRNSNTVRHIKNVEDKLVEKDTALQVLQEKVQREKIEHEHQIVKLQEKVDAMRKHQQSKQQILNEELLIAAQQGDMTKMQSALILGAIITAKNDQGQTALHLSMRHNHRHIATYLLTEYPTLFLMEDNNALSPIKEAANKGEVDKLTWLYEQGNAIPAFYKSTMAFDSLLYAATPAMKILLANIKLLESAERGDAEWVMKALEYHPALHVKTKDGDTALHLAVKGGYIETVKLLLAHNADPTIYNTKQYVSVSSKDQTVLDLAKKNSELLPIIATHFLIHAALHGVRDDIVNALAFGANLSGVDSYGDTALHKAIQGGNKDAVKLLLKKHVQTNHPIDMLDKQGKTPLALAENICDQVNTKLGNKLMADYMLEKMGAYKAEEKLEKRKTTLSTSSFGLMTVPDSEDKVFTSFSSQCSDKPLTLGKRT